MIPLSSPDITNVERRAVLSILETDRLSLGPKAKEFEKRIAAIAKRKYAVTANSGTAALHLIIRALGIGKGDEVITTPFSFIASANCIVYEGAKPVFVDIEEQTFTIDPATTEKQITPRTKAILIVDVFGHPADWNPLLEIAERHRLKVIEDSAEALGSSYRGKPCGSFGVASTFSFYPNKQITTGEGGVVVTDDPDIAELCQSMANQGRKAQGGTWLEHVRIGFNYRLPEIPCALGIAQLSRLEKIVQKRTRVARWYTERLKEVPELELPVVALGVKMSWFVYVVRLSEKYTVLQRDRVIAFMAEKGIQCGTYFSPIHLQPPYRKMFGYRGGEFPVTERVGSRTIALPFFNNLSEKEIDTVVNILKQALAYVS